VNYIRNRTAVSYSFDRDATICKGI